MELQWWLWLIAGLTLVILEIFTASFFIIWFGIGAVLVGLLSWCVADLSATGQIFIWITLSSATALFWFKRLRPRTKDHRWTADAVIGEVGLLSVSVAEFQKGRVRFQKPILGNEEWVCTANTAIAAGERVKIIDIEGNTVRVAKA